MPGTAQTQQETKSCSPFLESSLSVYLNCLPKSD